MPFYFASTGISTRDLERARRLFYVAVTRAIDAVVLIPGRRFTAWGYTYRTKWSQFIADIQREISGGTVPRSGGSMTPNEPRPPSRA